MGRAEAEAEREEGGEDGAEQDWPFEVDDGDHFETPREAFEDIVPLLRCHARRRAVERQLPAEDATSQLRVYDPYFCTGRSATLLGELGFPRVINRRRDFYRDIAEGAVPKFDVLMTNPPYSSDHKKRLFDWILERQRGAAARGSREPFALLLPSWTVGKALFHKFLKGLAEVYASTGVEAAPKAGMATAADSRVGVFYVCRRGQGGRPLKYVFDHVRGAGLADCPFFGLWICGGFGDAAATHRAVLRVARGEAQGFWPADGSWHSCRPRGPLAEPLAEPPPVATAAGVGEEEGGEEPEVDVVWADGTQRALPAHHLSGGRLVFTSSLALEAAGLLRSAEDIKRRQEENPNQRLRHERALAALERQRASAREAKGGKRKRSTGQRRYEKHEEAAAAVETPLSKARRKRWRDRHPPSGSSPRACPLASAPRRCTGGLFRRGGRRRRSIRPVPRRGGSCSGADQSSCSTFV